MAVKPRVLGIDDFQLSVAGLTRLGDRRVHLSVQLTGRNVSVLRRFRPKQRNEQLRDARRKQLERLRRRFPTIGFISRGKRLPSSTVDAVVPARQVRELASRPEVNHVYVETIDGRRRKPRRIEPRWFCVWGIVAVQIEGQRTGLITLEDRLMVVKANDFDHAERRLQHKWLKYSEPYLNSDGCLVRWRLIEVGDVYELPDDEFDPHGTEVYSRLRSVRLRPKYRWEPERS